MGFLREFRDQQTPAVQASPEVPLPPTSVPPASPTVDAFTAPPPEPLAQTAHFEGYGGLPGRESQAPGQLQPPPHGPVPRRRRPSIWSIAIASMAAAIAVLLAVVVIPSPRPWVDRAGGPQILNKSLAAATRAGTAHVQVSNTGDGPDVAGTVDISPSGGVETSTFGTHTMTVVYVGGSLYMRADPALLSEMFDLPAAVADRYRDRWILLPTDNPDLQQMAGELQTSIVVSDLLDLAGPVTRAAGHPAGQVTLLGKLADNAYNRGSGAGDLTTLAVSSTSPYYPLSISYSDPQNGATRMAFSRWGERVELTAPKGAVPLSQVTAGAASAPTGTATRA